MEAMHNMVQAYLKIDSDSNFNSTTGLLSNGSAVLLFDSQDMFNSSSEFQISIAGKWTHAEQNNLRFFTLENKNDSTAGYLCLTHSESRRAAQFGYVRYDNGNANTATIIKDDNTSLVDVDRHFSVKFKQESNFVIVQGYNVSGDGSLSALGSSTSVSGTGNPKLNKITIKASANFKPNLYSIQILSGLGDFAGHYIAKEARTFAGTRIQLRHDTADNWTNFDPVLAVGEVGIEIDSNKTKIGNGTSPYTELPYSNQDTTLQQETQFTLNLTGNGTLGGSTPACTGSTYETGHPYYYAFKGATSSTPTKELWGPSSAADNQYLILDCVTPIALQSFRWTNGGNSQERFPTIVFKGSNDNSSYTTLGTYNTQNPTDDSVTIENYTPYRYYRFDFPKSASWGKIGFISMSGFNRYNILNIGDGLDVIDGQLTCAPSDAPILDVPVNNCVLAMPTAPTFDGTNVKVYAGTKVAIPNGLNADGTCKSNIVTLTTDATINQSTFNGDVTLMLKSDGTIDQTTYSYFEVDDISTITTLTAYCWYYDRKTNNHYLASSTGAKQGPYQRIKIGSYNQATDATTKYFRTYRPIALESNNGGSGGNNDGSASMPSNKSIDLTLGASGTEYTAPANGYFYINKVAGSDWYYVRMRNAISNIDLFVDAYRTTPLTSIIPAKKGEIVYVYYNATGTTNSFRFIYAEGSK